MKVLMVYDSVSAQRLTEKVAEAIREELSTAGLQVDSDLAKDADPAKVKEYDCLVVGTPTMGWSATPPVKKFLEGIAGGEVAGKATTTFDTQIKSIMSGSANKKMVKRLNEIGLKVVSPSLIAYVEGRGQNMNLKAGELEKAKSWARDLAKMLASR